MFFCFFLSCLAFASLFCSIFTYPALSLYRSIMGPHAFPVATWLFTIIPALLDSVVLYENLSCLHSLLESLGSRCSSTLPSSSKFSLCHPFILTSPVLFHLHVFPTHPLLSCPSPTSCIFSSLSPTALRACLATCPLPLPLLPLARLCPTSYLHSTTSYPIPARP